MNITEFKTYLESAVTDCDLNECNGSEVIEITSNDNFIMTLNDVYVEVYQTVDKSNDYDVPDYITYEMEFEVGEDVWLSTKYDNEIAVTHEMLDAVQTWLNGKV